MKGKKGKEAGTNTGLSSPKGLLLQRFRSASSPPKGTPASAAANSTSLLSRFSKSESSSRPPSPSTSKSSESHIFTSQKTSNSSLKPLLDPNSRPISSVSGYDKGSGHNQAESLEQKINATDRENVTAEMANEKQNQSPNNVNISLKPGAALRVIVAHHAADTDELELEVGDIVELDETPATDDEYWWRGTNRSWGPNNGMKGLFPSQNVKLEEWSENSPESPINTEENYTEEPTIPPQVPSGTKVYIYK
jgi:hypothetical protein